MNQYLFTQSIIINLIHQSMIRPITLILLLFILFNLQTVEAKAKNNKKKIKSPSLTEKCNPKKTQCKTLIDKQNKPTKPSQSYDPQEDIQIDPRSYKSWSKTQNLDSNNVFQSWLQGLTSLGFFDLIRLLLSWKIIWFKVKYIIVWSAFTFLVSLCVFAVLLIATCLGFGNIFSFIGANRNNT